MFLRALGGVRVADGVGLHVGEGVDVDDEAGFVVAFVDVS